MEKRYEHLMSPLKIGSITLKNRYAVSALAANNIQRGPWGELTEDCIEYRAARAHGGFGLFVTNSNYPDLIVDKPGKSGITSPFYVPAAFKQTAMRMLDRMHYYDTKVFMQVAFGPGRIRGSKAPSEMPLFWDPSKKTEVITTEEIKLKIDQMIKCAKLAQTLGYDGVEVHALHWGYALDQFTIPWMNDRTDEYGAQTWDSRLAIPKQLVEGIKAACGKDFPVAVALGLKHFMAGFNKGTLTGEGEVGRSLEDAIEIAKRLESYGYDMLDCDAGCYEAYYINNPPYYMPKCYELFLSKEVKKAVGIPVFMTGKMTDPDICEAAIANGELDGVSLGRASMVDPEYPNKVMQGHPEKIRPCIACTNCIHTMNTEGLPKCSVNPNAFLDYTYQLGTAPQKKNVVVVGGGIAGMAAAEYLTKRGHSVELYEAGDVLGGHLFEAFHYDFKGDIRDLYDWYIQELKSLNVSVHLNSPLTAEQLKAMKPDAVVLATGSAFAAPQIAGCDSDKVVSLQDAIYGKKPLGRRVAVVGAGSAGAELALELAKNRGKEVVLVEAQKDVLLSRPVMAKPARDMLIELLKHNGVAFVTGAVVTAVTAEGVSAEQNGEKTDIPADSVVFSLGMTSRPSMQNELMAAGIDAYSIGDEAKVGNIRSCTSAAYDVARRL